MHSQRGICDFTFQRESERILTQINVTIISTTERIKARPHHNVRVANLDECKTLVFQCEWQHGKVMDPKKEKQVVALYGD